MLPTPASTLPQSMHPSIGPRGLSLFGICNTMTIYNIVDCVPRVHHVWSKQNTIYMDNKIIMMTNDLHVPV